VNGIDDILAAYMDCALWASTDDDGEPLDGWGIGDIAPEAVAAMAADVADFIAMVDAAGISREAWTDDQFGHDLWLTRNRHGAGFWDRGHGEPGDRLTDIAHAMGEASLYVRDDGLIYHYPEG
jgi:hypothetical protein